MAKIEFKPGTMLNPIPAVMVSCGDEREQNIITIAWTGIVNTDPPMTYISVRKERYSHDIIARTGEFVINLTTKDLAFATDYCGVRSGRNVDKFKEMKLTAAESRHVSCPSIGESPVNLECRVLDIREFPTHDMFLAEIVGVSVDEDLMDEKSVPGKRRSDGLQSRKLCGAGAERDRDVRLFRHEAKDTQADRCTEAAGTKKRKTAGRVGERRSLPQKRSRPKEITQPREKNPVNRKVPG